MATHPPLCVLDNIRVTRGGSPALDGISLSLYPRQHHAVLGGNGSGKSTLLRLMAGLLPPDQQHGGTVTWHIHGIPQQSPLMARPRYGLVCPELRDQYIRHAWHMTGQEVVLSGFSSGLMPYTRPTEQQCENAVKTARLLNAESLLKIPLPALSQGQLGIILVARAMVRYPDVLLLDEVYEGLDASCRKQMLHAVELVASSDVTILVAGHRTEGFPSCIQHGILLQRGRVCTQGPLDHTLAYMRQSMVSRHACSISATPLPPAAGTPKHAAMAVPTVELANVQVFIKRIQVLYNITWRIESGQSWTVLGPNGAGKSTLMRLVYGDIPQAWGGTVRWFGQEQPFPLHSIRTRIGMVSDALQATYGHDKYHGSLLSLSGEKLVHSGFFSTTGLQHHTVHTEQRQQAAWCLERLGLTAHAHQPIRTMSHGMLRRFMMARALVQKPQLLILDEPFSGMDEAARKDLKALLRVLMQQGMQLVLVTHHKHDIIPEITHELHMCAGRIIHGGLRSLEHDKE